MESLDQEDKEGRQVLEGRGDPVGQLGNQVLRVDQEVTGLLDHLEREG